MFNTRGTRLNASGLHSVDRLVGFLTRFPRRRAFVEGYTDSNGTGAMNKGLSVRRAELVRRALLQGGIDADRVVAHGFGEAFPRASNDSVDGRRLNRRVEIVLSDGTGGALAR